ncbi:class I SAM-dependent methyltransferase [Rhodovulum sp. PH10]|uniref:class I SAM-dependent methyltransferase n=1 Tax=Rhodovulum sp. PH10 TaxID=1187851 RepID=UPI00178C6A6C|nr:class I SAM-dependent methyltransferase [Rhodovulum sp. PH10]
MPSKEHELWFAPEGGSSAVPGFLTSVSAQFISTLLTYQIDKEIKGSISEIGTFMGKTFVGLVKASRRDEIVLGLDVFPEYVELGFKKTMSQLPKTEVENVVAVKKSSRDVSTLEWISRLKTPARFIHIDGEHSYDAIANDLRLASSFLSKRSIVVIDDFLHDWYPDLTEGIIDSFKILRNIVPIAVAPRLGHLQDGGTKLICSTEDGALEYRNHILNTFRDKKARTVRFVGREIITFQGF